MTRSKKRASNARQPVSIAHHLQELRTRIGIVILFFVVVSAGAYQVRDQILAIILQPIGNEHLIYLTPAGGFNFIFMVSIYTGLFFTIPLMLWHLYRFIVPALPPTVKQHSGLLLFASAFLMLAGAGFGYFFAIPAALNFLTTFADSYVSASLTAESYLNFLVTYLVGLGMLFQMPLLLIIWNRVSRFAPGTLLRTQQWTIPLVFILAAIITPTPDILNMLLVAGPVLAIYEIGVVSVWVINRRYRKRALKR